MHAAAQGRPVEALHIARSVLEGSYSLSPRLRALFLTRKARALAGDEGSLRVFPQIRDLFLDGVSDDDPAWTWWVDEHELAWHEAMALRDLGRASEARALFEQSMTGTPPTEIRGQYIHGAYLLQAQVDNGSWADAEREIRRLLPLSAGVASTRAVVLLRDPELGQHFLVSAEKLSQLVAAAGIRREDDVLEAGAGVGTVARVLPQCRSLTVVELDPRLTGYLQDDVPHATVRQADALQVIQDASFDVLIGNLPHAVTESLLKLLPSLSFRTAVMAVSLSSDLDQLGPAFSWSEVTRITGDDFVPPQADVSHVVRIAPYYLSEGS